MTFKGITTTMVVLQLLMSGYSFREISKESKIEERRLRRMVNQAGYRKVKGKWTQI